jgi:T4 gene Gp59 loader of gp41 DNA helicase
MTPFETYCEYVSLKNHFSKDSYDYFKYNGKSRLKPTTFQKRKDRVFFEKLAKHTDVHGFLVANLSVNEKLWIRDLAYSENAELNYKNWVKNNQSLTYVFKQDLNKLDAEFDKNFLCVENQHPILLQLYLSNEISLESLCVLLDITKATKYWNREMEFDLVWDMLKLKIKKYTPFIQYDKEKFKKITLDFFSEV